MINNEDTIEYWKKAYLEISKENEIKEQALQDIKEKLEKLNNEILSSRTLTCYEVSQRTQEEKKQCHREYYKKHKKVWNIRLENKDDLYWRVCKI